MSLFSFLLGAPERKVLDTSALVEAAFLGSGGSSKTGLSVSEESALRTSVVWACCRVICEDIGKIPVKLMRDDVDTGTTEVARGHRLHRILSRRPNQWQTAMEYRMTMMLHALLTTGGYSAIVRSNDDAVMELIPLMPRRVKVIQDKSWNVRYEVMSSDGTPIAVLHPSQVHTIHGLSWNGYTGLDLIKHGTEAIGLAMALEESQARMHGNGAKPGGVITTQNKLNKEQVDRIKQQFAEGYSGVANVFKTMLLDNGLEFKPWQMSGVDTQHLETRRFEVEDLCRFFRVFPSMVGYSDKAATYASSESFFGAHVGHTLQPWVTLWEQASDRDLLTEQEQEAGYHVKFMMQGLLRGDSAARATFYKSGITDGWMTRNEVRRLEDLNPLPGLDDILQPLNMTPTGKAPADPAADPIQGGSDNGE